MGNVLGIESRVFPGRPVPSARRDIVERFGEDAVEIRRAYVSWTTSRVDDGRPPLHVVCFHGNMEDVASTMSGWIERTGATRLTAVEYPGYGWRVDETPTEAKIVEEVENEIASTIVEGERTIVCGRSIGTYPALVLADTKKCDGVVLVSPPLSAVSTAIPPGMLQRALALVDVANNGVRAARLDPSIPVFVAHGEDDRVVPVSNARALVEILSRAKGRDVRFLKVKGAGHNDVTADDMFRRRLRDFVITS
ncbi:MAG: hypothetical protein CMI16_06990 [Opitutaceae bacterium]|nr:hypothetical protein [Opitutaceae bacterium]